MIAVLHVNPVASCRRRFPAISLLALVLATATAAENVSIAPSAEEVTPLAAGVPAPRFEVTAVDGSPFIFDPANLDRPAMLITFRGGWCPYCNMHLSELRNVIPRIRSMGIDVLFLSGDRPELLVQGLSAETQEDVDGLDYTIYSDAEANAAIALGVAFEASDRTIERRHEKGQDIAGSSMERHGVLPVPALFAIDREGIIRFKHTNADYKVRLPAARVLEVAATMADDDDD